MTDNVIEELFSMLSAGEDVKINPDGAKALDIERDKIEQKIIDSIGENNFSEIDDFIGKFNYMHENYGFVTGFKYAMHLMLASIGKE